MFLYALVFAVVFVAGFFAVIPPVNEVAVAFRTLAFVAGIVVICIGLVLWIEESSGGPD